MDALLKEAEEAEAARKLAKACILYRKALQKRAQSGIVQIGRDQRAAETHTRLGNILMRRRREREAIAAYREAIEAEDTPELRCSLGDALLAADDVIGALVEFERAAKQKPALASAYLGIGKARMKQNDLPAAILMFTKAAGIAPKAPEPLLLLAEASEKLGRGNDVGAYLQAAVEAVPTHLGTFSVIAQLLPSITPLRGFLDSVDAIILAARSNDVSVAWARTLSSFEHVDRAFTHLATLIAARRKLGVSDDELPALIDAMADVMSSARDQTDLPPSVEHLFRRWPAGRAQWGGALAVRGMTAAAAKQLVVAAKGGAQATAVAFLRANDFQLDKQHCAQLNTAAKKVTDPETLAAAAVVLCQSGDVTAGEALFERARSLRDSADLRSAWASALVAAERYDEAVPHVLEAVRRGSRDISYLRGPEPNSLPIGEILANTRSAFASIGEILTWILAECTSNSDDPSWPEVLAAFADGAVRSPEFLKQLETVVVHSGNTQARVQVAAFFASHGDIPAAERVLKTAIEADPGNAVARLALSRHYAARGERDAAIEHIAAVAESEEHLGEALSAWVELVTTQMARSGDRDALLQLVRNKLAAKSLDSVAGAGLLVSLGEYDAALEEFSRAADEDPGRYDLYESWGRALDSVRDKRGVAALLADNTSAAMAVIKVVPRRLFADRSESSTETPFDELRSRLSQVADAWLQHVLQYAASVRANCDEDTNGKYALVARLLLKVGAVEEAERLLEAAPGRERSDEMQYLLAHAQSVQGKHDAAIRTCDAAIGRPSLGSNMLDFSFPIHMRRIRSLLSLRRFHEVTLALDELAARDGDLSDENREECGDVRANALSEQGRDDEALAVHREQVRRFPGSFWAHFHYGILLSRLGLMGESMVAYERALAVEGAYNGHPFAYHNIASNLDDQGLYRASRASWDKACEAYASRLQAGLAAGDHGLPMYYGMAQYEVRKKYHSGEWLLRAAMTLDSWNLLAPKALALLYLEWSRTLTGDRSIPVRAKALDMYRHALRNCRRLLTNYQDRDLLVDCGELHLAFDAEEEAAAAFAAAAKVDPDSPRVQKGLGDVALRHKNFDAAIRHYRAAQRTLPTDLGLMALLGQAHRKAGELDEAEAEYKRVVSVSRHHVDAMVGLGEVYLDMAEKRSGDKDAADREDFYHRAVDCFGEAISTYASVNRPPTTSVRISEVHYLRGYARVRMSDTARAAIRRDLVNSAVLDFDECCRNDSEHHKAKRARQRVRDMPESIIQRAVDQYVSPVVIIMAVVLFIMTLTGRPMVRDVVTVSGITNLVGHGVPQEIVEALMPMEQSRHVGASDVLVRARQLAGADKVKPHEAALLRGALRSERRWQLVQMDFAALGVLAFGSLAFLIAGAYLPQLTALKVAGIQLEKSSGDRVEATRSISVRR